MIAIVNVSPEGTPTLGPNEYKVRINQTVITQFTHDRQVGGLEQCLRDAADAVKLAKEKKTIGALMELSKLDQEMWDWTK